MKLIKKLVLIFVITASILTAGFFTLINDKPQQFFDLSNTAITYIITADENYYQLQPTNSNNRSQVIIASSPKNLNDFLNKEVHVTGKFIFTESKDILCPQNDCQRLKKSDFNLEKKPVSKMEAIEIQTISLIN